MSRVLTGSSAACATCRVAQSALSGSSIDRLVVHAQPCRDACNTDTINYNQRTLQNCTAMCEMLLPRFL